MKATRALRLEDLGTFWVMLLTVNEFAGVITVLGPRIPGLTFTGMLALATIAALAVIARTRRDIPWGVLAAMVCYVVANAVSSAWSTLDPAVTSDGVLDIFKEFYFLLLICILGVSADRWTHVAAVLVVPISIIGWLAAANEWVFSGANTFLGFENMTLVEGAGTVTGRHAGPLQDANFWGRLLVVGVPFCLAMMVSLAARGRRALALICWPLLGGILVAIYLTSSRGAYIGVFAEVLVIAIFLERYRRWFMASLALTPFVLLVPGIGSRLAATLGIFGADQHASVDSSVLERVSAQQVALQMIEEHPLTGVGPGGYMYAFPEVSANTGLSLQRIVASHNGLLGIAAEIGVIGAFCWLAVIALALFSALRSLAFVRAALPEQMDDRFAPYVVATFAALIGWMVTTIFLHVTYQRVLWLLVAFAGLQQVQARRLVGAGREQPSVIRSFVTPRIKRSIGIAAVGVAVGMVGYVVTPTMWVAKAEGWLEPTSTDPYLISVRSRERIVPTYALVVGLSSPGHIDAQGDPQTGRIILRASASDAATARAYIIDATATGKRVTTASGLDRLYVIEWAPVVEFPSERSTTPIFLGGLVGAAIGALLPTRRSIRQSSNS